MAALWTRHTCQFGIYIPEIVRLLPRFMIRLLARYSDLKGPQWFRVGPKRASQTPSKIDPKIQVLYFC